MRYIVAAALLSFPSGIALAQTDATPKADIELVERYYQVRPQCREGTFSYPEMTEAQVEAACAERERIGTILVERGYCWYAGEQTWQRTCDGYAPLPDSK